MPSNPPMVLPTSEAAIESAPNIIGTNPPAVEPIIIAIIIKLFLDMAPAYGLFLMS